MVGGAATERHLFGDILGIGMAVMMLIIRDRRKAAMCCNGARSRLNASDAPNDARPPSYRHQMFAPSMILPNLIQVFPSHRIICNCRSG
jgi:hypothetical protein